MNMFITCPKCHEPMTGEIMVSSLHGEVLHKKCVQYNHNIHCVSSSNLDMIKTLTIIVNLTSNLMAIFDFEKQTLNFCKDCKFIAIPFFEPDVSNYDKLVRKLNTYITFG